MLSFPFKILPTALSPEVLAKSNTTYCVRSQVRTYVDKRLFHQRSILGTPLLCDCSNQNHSEIGYLLKGPKPHSESTGRVWGE